MTSIKEVPYEIDAPNCDQCHIVELNRLAFRRTKVTSGNCGRSKSILQTIEKDPELAKALAGKKKVVMTAMRETPGGRESGDRHGIPRG